MARDFLQYRNHYVRDWETSETVRLMSYTARGVYQALLDAQWEKGSIPAEPEVCERLLRCEAGDWAHFAPFFEQCFPIGEDGRRRNERLHDDREQAQELVRKKTGAAQKRWGKSADAELEPKGAENDAPAMHLHSTSKADAMQEQCPTTTTTTTTTTDSFFPESASSGNTTPPEEEDSLRLPVTGSPEKEQEATPWFEDGVSETRELREAAAKVAATRIRSRSKQFPYRGISVADAKRVLKALAPCPSPEDARLFWDSWYAYHADRTKPPYTQLGQAVENWARKRTVEWARLKRHEEAVARNSRGAYDNIPTWTPGGAA
jgi:uncharacterized protein YdaU (DUF1376 family)